MTTVPSAPPTIPPASPGPPDTETSRRTTWAAALARLRAGVHTEPGRLRIIAAVLAALMLLFGGATAWQLSDRAAATDTVVDDSQPLTVDTAALLHALASANTTAAAGFLADGENAPEIREQYEEHVSTASTLLTTVAARTGESAEAERHLAVLSEGFPVYTGLVEAARANDRQGYPLGGAYLRYADRHMQDTLLPAAEELYALERARYQDDLAGARNWPWLALGTGVLALTALVLVQRRQYLRTNRVFNRGLVTATAAGTLLVLWLITGHAVAASALGTAHRDGARSLHVLNEVRTESTRALGDQHMILVMRGGGQEFVDSFDERMQRITGTRTFTGGDPGLLDEVAELADDSEGRASADQLSKRVNNWSDNHERLLDEVAAGDHESAARRVLELSERGGAAVQVENRTERAISHEQAQFDEAAGRAGGWFSGLTVTAVVVGVFGAGATLLGIGRRLSEYR